MKEYTILSSELFKIKTGVLNVILSGGSAKSASYPQIVNETGRQLRTDLDDLKKELFSDEKLSPQEHKELRKINEKIMVKYAAIKRRLAHQA